MQNTVELIGYYGSDETHALSAWTSTKRELTEERKGRIDKLLNMLAQSDPQHTSPFEKSSLHFIVTTDIATHIHIIKHRIGVSVNAESARYKELTENKYYIPDDWPGDLKNNLEEHIKQCQRDYHFYLTELEKRGFTRKRAKESARFILPYAHQITSDVMFNFKSFMHFQKLRNEEGAQLEIQLIAKEMLQQVKEIDGNPFKYSLSAFGYD